MSVSGVPGQKYHGNNGRSGARNACEAGWATASLQGEAKGAGQTSKEARSSVSMTLSPFPLSLSLPFAFRNFKSHKTFGSGFLCCNLLSSDLSQSSSPPACVFTCACASRKEETPRSPARRGPGRPRKRKPTLTAGPVSSSEGQRKVKWVSFNPSTLAGWGPISPDKPLRITGIQGLPPTGINRKWETTAELFEEVHSSPF